MTASNFIRVDIRGPVSTVNEEDRRTVLPVLAETEPQPLTTPSGVSRLVGRTRDAEAAMTVSMSL